jgi:hypothetical protein
MTFAMIKFTSFAVLGCLTVCPAFGDVFVNQLGNTKKAYLSQATLNARVLRAPPPQTGQVTETGQSKVAANPSPRPSAPKPSIRITDFSQIGANNRVSIPSVRNGVQSIVNN